MELVIDILLEIYLELMLLVIPEENASKKHILWAKIIAISVTFLLVALFVFGVILIVEYDNMWGIAPITIAAGCSLAQVIAGILLFKKNR